MPDAYLATALTLCNLAKKNSSYYMSKNGEEGNVFGALRFASSHPNYELVYPIIYNFKHGIELYLKGLSNIDFGKYKGVHDIKIIFEFLKDHAKDKGNPNHSAIRDLYNSCWPVIEKYYYGTYIPGRKSKNSPDKYNEAERYPEKKLGQKKGRLYKIKDVHSWAKEAFFDKVENDIRFIEKHFAQAKRDIVPTKRFCYGRKRKSKSSKK